MSWEKWFEQKWQEFEDKTLKEFIQSMNSDGVLEFERARFLLRIAEKIHVDPKSMVRVQLSWQVRRVEA